MLAWAPGALDRWTLPKLLLIVLAALVALAATPRGRLPRSVIVLGLVGAALIVVSALLAADPLSAALGRWPRFDGLIALSGAAVAAWLGARMLGPGSTTEASLPSSSVATRSAVPAPARGLARATAIGAGLLALMTAAEQFGLRPIPTDLDRPGALLGSASDQGAVAAVALIMLVALNLGEGARDMPPTSGQDGAPAPSRTLARAEQVLIVAGAVGALATVVASGSRAALLAAALGLVTVAGLRLAQGTPKKWRTLAPIGVALAGLTVGALALPSTAQRLLGGDALAAESAADRLLIWADTLAVIAAHPVIGTAPGRYLDSVTAAHREAWFSAVGPDTQLDSPHSLPLQLLVGGGPALVLIALAVLALAARGLQRGLAAMGLTPHARADAHVLIAAAGGVVALLTALLVQPTAAATLLLLGLLVGALVAVPATGSSAEPLRPAEPVEPAERPEPPAGPAAAAYATTSSPAATAQRLRTAGTAALLTGLATLLAVMLAGEGHLGRAAQLATGTAPASAVDEALRQAQALRPGDPDVAIIGADLLVARVDGGDTSALAAAQTWTDRALRAAPASLTAGRAAVTLALAAGDLPAARERVDALVQVLPEHPWPAHRSGAIAVLEGDTVRAESELLRASRIDPNWDAPWQTLAALYELMGDSASAQRALQEAAARSDGR